MTHLRDGLYFNKRDEVAWQPRPVDKINIKLIDNSKKIAVRLDASQDMNFKIWLYEWENTIIVYSYFKQRWIKSKSSWLLTVNRLKYGPWEGRGCKI